jgi:hypothetical protein
MTAQHHDPLAAGRPAETPAAIRAVLAAKAVPGVLAEYEAELDAAFARAVSTASPKHLLAMKVMAARRRDGEDISYLIKHLALPSVAAVLDVCALVFPDQPVPDRARLILEDLLGET